MQKNSNELDISIFKFIPDDIGDIVYYDTTNRKTKPNSRTLSKNQAWLIFLFSLAIIVAIWLFFYQTPIRASLISIVPLAILLACLNTSEFRGTDYFVGTDGFVSANFEGSRDNIVNRSTHYFKDFTDLVVEEIKIYGEYHTYKHTQYHFEFFSMDELDSEEIEPTFSSSITYNENIFSNKFKGQDIKFLKAIEAAWTYYKFQVLAHNYEQNKDHISFNLFLDDDYIMDYISFKENNMFIRNHRYNRDNIKNIDVKDGYLTIEDIDFNSKNYGLEYEGNKEVIRLSQIGNNIIFIQFLQHFMNLINYTPTEKQTTATDEFKQFLSELPKILVRSITKLDGLSVFS